MNRAHAGACTAGRPVPLLPELFQQGDRLGFLRERRPGTDDDLQLADRLGLVARFRQRLGETVADFAVGRRGRDRFLQHLQPAADRSPVSTRIWPSVSAIAASPGFSSCACCA